MSGASGAGGPALDAADLSLLEELRETVDRVDPCPAGLGERVKFALTVQSLHAQVAELTRGEGALTRGADDEPDRMATMTFSTDSVSIMVTVTEEDPDLTRIDGWLTCERAEVELVRPGGTEQRVSVSDGRFVLTGVPAGSARLVVHLEDARPVVTPTFSL
ncbi:carboxypeptidase regulatory-like domain-containing protein [Serinicoccus sp. LYQ131]|uniref:carboxypeptidase regulatory-like domain-containing protein n=1 Tax=Serinicoccus sp. LYQ131 TaxID=3378797 RepID=UPI0038544752